MGISQSKDTETINWQNINTNDMSSTIPNLHGISKEARELVSKLNLPEISENNSEFNIDNVFKPNTNQVQQQNISEENSSSPFISSEMYNYLLNKYNDNKVEMTGGAPKKVESEENSTSSSSEVESSSDVQESKKKDKQSKKIKNSAKSSENYLSYVSSSAHTGGSMSEAEESLQNENQYSISSVNTSDINMITED
jgi:hypothetical protein